MSPLDVTLALVALLGHAAICVGVLNRSHAMGMPRVIVKAITALSFLWLPLGPSIALAPLVHGGSTPAVLQAGIRRRGMVARVLDSLLDRRGRGRRALGAAGVARQAAQTFDIKSHATWWISSSGSGIGRCMGFCGAHSRGCPAIKT